MQFVLTQNLIAVEDAENGDAYWTIAHLHDTASLCDNLDDLLQDDEEETDQFYFEFEIDENTSEISIEGFYFSEEITTEKIEYGGTNSKHYNADVNIERIQRYDDRHGRIKGSIIVRNLQLTDNQNKVIIIDIDLSFCTGEA